MTAIYTLTFFDDTPLKLGTAWLPFDGDETVVGHVVETLRTSRRYGAIEIAAADDRLVRRVVRKDGEARGSRR